MSVQHLHPATSRRNEEPGIRNPSLLSSRLVPSLSRQPPAQTPLAEEMEPSNQVPGHSSPRGRRPRAIPGGIIVDNPSKRVPTGFGVGFDLRTPPASEPTTSRQKVISSAGQSCCPIAEFHIITRHTGHAEKAPGLIGQAFTVLGRERVVGPSCIGILSEKGRSAMKMTDRRCTGGPAPSQPRRHRYGTGMLVHDATLFS